MIQLALPVHDRGGTKKASGQPARYILPAGLFGRGTEQGTANAWPHQTWWKSRQDRGGHGCFYFMIALFVCMQKGMSCLTKSNIYH